MMNLGRWVPAVLRSMVVGALCAATATAQADIIRGTVTGPDSQPIVNANVLVSALATNVAKTAKTDRYGMFSVAYPDGTGDYWVTVQAIGFTQRRFAVKRFGNEDALIADVRLQKAATLDPIRIAGRRPQPSTSDAAFDITRAERTLAMSSLDISMMTDLSALGMLLPGAIYTPSVDGGLGSFSLYGLEPDFNTFMINGMIVAPGLMPREAGMTGTIAGSPYDASRPGGAGALVSARFEPGRNYVIRRLSVSGLSPRLQWSDPTTRSIGNQPTTISVSGATSGPIVRNAVHYNVAFQFDDNSFALRTLDNTNALGLEAAGLAADSVVRVRNALTAAGIPFSVAGFPRRDLSRQGSFIGGLSYAPPQPRFGSFSLTMLGNRAERAPSSGVLYAAPSHSGESTRWGGSASARHSILIGRAFYVQTVVGASADHGESRPYLRLPDANIRVASDFADERGVVRSIGVGGNSSMGGSSSSRSVQVTNTVGWSSMNNKHALSLGTHFTRRSDRRDRENDVLGSFLFNSIGDFEMGRPTAFTRLLAPRAEASTEESFGIGINNSWRPDSLLQMTAGIRADASRLDAAPARNPLIEETFGIRNDRIPHSIGIEPRVSFSRDIGTAPQIAWMIGARRGPKYVLSGGAGVFASAPSTALASAAINNTGLPSAVQQLSCVGDAAPLPDWSAYLADPASVPAVCADGTVHSVFSNAAPSVTVIDPAYRGLRRTSGDVALRGSTLGNRLNFSVRLIYARNEHVNRTVNLNFDPTVRFALAGEGNRPVFVEPTSIVPATGAIAVGDALVSPAFNRVGLIRSDLRSDSKTLSIAIAPVGYNPVFQYTLGYAMLLNRRMVPGSESTVGNPLDSEWSLTNQGQIHRFTLGLSANIRNTVKLSWTVTASSGVPVTPRIAGDVNGDGYNNDRAFVFDPDATSDTALASAMRTLLASGSPIARSCLSEQLGRLAALGRCRGPWTIQGGNSLQVKINPIAMRMPQRASLQFEIGNPVGAVDMLLHGPSRVRGWGRSASPEQTLLYVRGFDVESRRFIYDVNQRFGSTRPRQSLTRTAPVTLRALVRVDLAASRERQSLTEMLDQGRRTRGVMVPEAIIKQVHGTGGVPAPLITMMAQADTLKLTPAQADTLSEINRWYSVRLDSIWTPLAHSLAALPRDYSRGEAYAIYQRGRAASFDLMIRIAPGVLALLTPAQRRMLPGPLAQQLDVRYLQTIRSSSVGMSDGMFGASPGRFGVSPIIYP